MGKTKRSRKGRRRPSKGESPGGQVETRSVGEDEKETPKGKDSEAERRPRPTTYDWVRENLEAILIAFILALIIRHFSVEAFEIPTGSMAPTLYGIHAWSKCPNCDTEFNMGLRSDSSTGELVFHYQRRPVYRGQCPNCGLRHNQSYGSHSARMIPGREVFRCQSEKCRSTWTGLVEDFREEIVFDKGDPPLRCPICQFEFRDVVTQSNRTGGHKILVNKFAYQISKPHRFDVIVFQKDEEHNYIKRLLGLPGEEVSIRGGDLYVKGLEDEGFHIVRKDDRPEVREALWFKIADSDVRERGYNETPAWKELFEKGSGLEPTLTSKWWTWLDEELRWSVNILQPTDRVAILRFARRCVNDYNYNLIGQFQRPAEEVGDKKVAFTVRPTKQNGQRGWIGGEIRDGDFTYQFRLPVGEAGAAVLKRLPTDQDIRHPDPNRSAGALDGEEATATAGLPFFAESRIEFENTDDRVAVRLNGTEILVLEYVSGSPDLSAPQRRSLQGEKPWETHSLEILASNVAADFEAIQVFRDIYYTHPPGSSRLSGPDKSLPVGSVVNGSTNEYFPAGDNSPSSYDGRFWGTVPQKNMMGKAFLIFWPAWPTNWQCRFIK